MLDNVEFCIPVWEKKKVPFNEHGAVRFRMAGNIGWSSLTSRNGGGERRVCAKESVFLGGNLPSVISQQWMKILTCGFFLVKEEVPGLLFCKN